MVKEVLSQREWLGKIKMLSELQSKIVHAPENKIVVAAACAVGKTRCIVERARYMLDKGIAPERMVLITFTNAAAAEMRERLGDCDGLFIGTIHGYCNYLLMSHGINTSRLLEKQQFDLLFELALNNLQCRKQVDYLLLDEAQDTDKNQYDFIFKVVRPEGFFFVGDWRQVIYGWRGVDASALLNLSKREDVTCYSLNENYRNGSAILDFARGLINKLGKDYYDTSIAMRGITGQVIKEKYSASYIINLLKNKPNLNKWYILCRTNQDVDDIEYALNRAEILNIVVSREMLDDINSNKMVETNQVKIMTIHCSKGLENDNVIVINPCYYNDEEYRISYVAATRARNSLYWMTKPNRRNTQKKTTAKKTNILDW